MLNGLMFIRTSSISLRRDDDFYLGWMGQNWQKEPVKQEKEEENENIYS
jgi:hypothetical protein